MSSVAPLPICLPITKAIPVYRLFSLAHIGIDIGFSYFPKAHIGIDYIHKPYIGIITEPINRYRRNSNHEQKF